MSPRRTRLSPHRKKVIAGRAVALRHCANWSEQILWAAIRGNQLGVQFRRQVPVGGCYIADFLASEIRLIVEVDGEIHTHSRGRDAHRDLRLRELGFTVLRIEATLVVRQVRVAATKIQGEIARLRSARASL